MKIVLISDTHEKHDSITIPECDILIHSGDCTNKGSLMSLYKFCAWLGQQPAKHKILIYGNHELGFSYGPKREDAINTPKQYGIHYLENSEIIIDGLKVYGSPITPYFYDWEWNIHRGTAIAKYWDNIPDDTNILVTHGPPRGILDLVDQIGGTIHEGCDDLLKRVNQLQQLKLHAFGHLHYSGGNTEIKNDKIFVNAAMCDDRHSINRDPIIVEI